MARIYADNAATTKMSKTAIAAMLPYFDEVYGNPSPCCAVWRRAGPIRPACIRRDK